MSKTRNRPILAVALLLVAALACNMPRRATPSASELVYTAAAQTQFAQQTLVAQPPVLVDDDQRSRVRLVYLHLKCICYLVQN